MRVLQINAVYETGSTGEIIKGINYCAHKQGIETYIACASYNNDDNNVVVIGNAIDHKLHALYSRVFCKQGYASKIATAKFLKKVGKINPDIIHLHNLHSNYINITMLFKYIKSHKIQTVITLHDCWYMTGKCCHFLDVGCEKWKTGCIGCPKLKGELPSIFIDNADKVLKDRKKYIGDNPYVHTVGCSEWVTGICKQSVISPTTFGTIHNGIDLDIFKPTKSSLRSKKGLEDKFVIMGMANKWLDPINADTYNYFTDNMSDNDVLMLIGCKPEQIGNLPKNVIGIGFVSDRKELAEYYSAADAFVNTTKVDTFPTVNIEALACGTPVVTYNSGGSAEAVTDNTGFVVDFGDYKSLFNAVNIIKESNFEYAGKCVSYSKEHFNKNNCYIEYLDLYKKLLENKE